MSNVFGHPPTPAAKREMSAFFESMKRRGTAMNKYAVCQHCQLRQVAKDHVMCRICEEEIYGDSSR